MEALRLHNFEPPLSYLLLLKNIQLLHRQALHEGGENSYLGEYKGEEKEGGRRSSVSLQGGEYYNAPLEVEVLCCAYCRDGSFFAVGASDGVVRVYNDSTKVLILTT